MTHPVVLTWDYANEPASTAETWVQSSDSRKVCGGLPNIVACDGDAVYRHTPDGRLWKLTRKEIPS